jgi:hypothetical protein
MIGTFNIDLLFRISDFMNSQQQIENLQLSTSNLKLNP